MKVYFAALHESAVSPSRHFAATQQSVAFGGIVLQNSAAFCSWAGFEHWSACGVLH